MGILTYWNRQVFFKSYLQSPRSKSENRQMGWIPLDSSCMRKAETERRDSLHIEKKNNEELIARIEKELSLILHEYIIRLSYDQ